MQYLKIVASFWNKIANIFFYCPSITHKDEHSQSLILFTIDICDKYFFCIIRKKVDKNFSVFLKRKKKDIEKMGLYFILAFGTK
jgi:hypothetical protein